MEDLVLVYSKACIILLETLASCYSQGFSTLYQYNHFDATRENGSFKINKLDLLKNKEFENYQTNYIYIQKPKRGINTKDCKECCDSKYILSI